MTCSHLTPSNTTTSYPSQSENIQACELLPEWKSCECCANGFVGYDKHDGPFTYCINGISMIATPLSDGKTCDDPQVGSLKSSPTWNLKTISQWMAAKQGTLVGADGEPLDEGDAVQEQLLGLDGKPIPKGTMLPVEGSGFTTLWSDESDPATSGPVSAFEEGGTYSFYVRQDETDTTTRPEAPQASPCPVWKKTTLSEVVYAVSAGYVLRSETLKGADSPDYIRNILCPKHGDTAYLTGVRKGLFVYDENNTLADDDGTVLGNWIRQAEYEVYPAWWGATEALADNGPMFNSAFAHMLTSDRILKISGRYRINQNLVYNFNGANDSFVMEGVGRGDSALTFASGFGLTVNSIISPDVHGHKAAVDITKLNFATEGSNNATAIQINTQVNSGAQSNKVNLQQLSFTGVSNDQGVWAVGIGSYGSSFGTFKDLIFNGSNNLGTNFRFRDDVVGVDNHISNIRSTACHTGIDIGGRYEGFYIQNFVCINVLNGILWNGDLSDGNTGQPLFTISDSHINSEVVGIKLQNVRVATMTNNVFFNLESGGICIDISREGLDPASTQLGIYTIGDNTFRGSNRGDRSVAINIHDNVDGVGIDNNVFYVHDIAVQYDDTSSNIRVSNTNVYRLIVADKRLVGPYNEGVFMDESFKTDGVKSGYRVGGTATWYRRALVTSTDPNNFTAVIPVQADDWTVGTEQVFLDRVDFVQVHEATNSVEPRTSYVRWDNIANENDKENIHISVSGLPVGETAAISIIAVGA